MHCICILHSHITSLPLFSSFRFSSSTHLTALSSFLPSLPSFLLLFYSPYFTLFSTINSIFSLFFFFFFFFRSLGDLKYKQVQQVTKEDQVISLPRRCFTFFYRVQNFFLLFFGSDSSVNSFFNSTVHIHTQHTTQHPSFSGLGAEYVAAASHFIDNLI